MQLCQAPPWPGGPVIVVDAGHASRSYTISPQVLPFTLRNRFSTLIGDVATATPDAVSSIQVANAFSASRAGRSFFHTTEGDKDIAKYFVPTAAIRDFCRPNSDL
jgi:hypothetical protein